jgi:hypothetical protein
MLVIDTEYHTVRSYVCPFTAEYSIVKYLWIMSTENARKPDGEKSWIFLNTSGRGGLRSSFFSWDWIHKEAKSMV